MGCSIEDTGEIVSNNVVDNFGVTTYLVLLFIAGISLDSAPSGAAATEAGIGVRGFRKSETGVYPRLTAHHIYYLLIIN